MHHGLQVDALTAGFDVTVPVRGIRLHPAAHEEDFQNFHVTVPVRGIRLHQPMTDYQQMMAELLSP